MPWTPGMPRGHSLWVDDVAVERAVKGVPVGRDLTTAERQKAVEYLFNHGESQMSISRHLNMYPRTVQRIMMRLKHYGRTDLRSNNE